MSDDKNGSSQAAPDWLAASEAVDRNGSSQSKADVQQPSQAAGEWDEAKVEPWSGVMPRADYLRAALSEIADLKSLTATPEQFSRHLQRLACKALTEDAMAEQPRPPAPPEGARVPAGMKLVPVEPTMAMIEAGERTPQGDVYWSVAQMYRAMLAAAPADEETGK